MCRQVLPNQRAADSDVASIVDVIENASENRKSEHSNDENHHSNSHRPIFWPRQGNELLTRSREQ